jgi:hypothetical protein
MDEWTIIDTGDRKEHLITWAEGHYYQWQDTLFRIYHEIDIRARSIEPLPGFALVMQCQAGEIEFIYGWN